MNITNLNKKNQITGKLYSSIGRYNDTTIALFKYDDVLTVVLTGELTKTVTKKDKENHATEYKLVNLKVVNKLVGQIRTVKEDGSYGSENIYENTVYYNNNLLFEVRTFVNKLEF